jgi:hypothetical protein
VIATKLSNSNGMAAGNMLIAGNFPQSVYRWHRLSSYHVVSNGVLASSAVLLAPSTSIIRYL